MFMWRVCHNLLPNQKKIKFVETRYIKRIDRGRKYVTYVRTRTSPCIYVDFYGNLYKIVKNAKEGDEKKTK